MRPVPNRALGKSNTAMRKVASAELNASMGKFKTGAVANPATKRAKTRSAKTAKAIREEMN